MDYTDYLIENLNKRISYSEYIAENVSSCTNYLIENLDRNISFSEYLAEQLDPDRTAKNRDKKIDEILS